MKDLESINKTRNGFEDSFSESNYYNIQTKDEKHLNKIIESLDLNDGYKVLDLGTGSGYLSFSIAENSPNCQIVGLDIVVNTLEKNREKVSEQKLKNLTFISYDGINFPFPDNTFDVIVTRYALHHFPEIKKSFKEISRVLKPGGQLFISDPTPNEDDKFHFIDKYMQMKDDGHIKFYTKDEFNELANSSGFKLERYFNTKIRFPRKGTEEYIKILAGTDESIINNYDIKIIGSEIFITEKVLNLSYRKN